MQKFILLFLIITSSFSAEINKALYEGDNIHLQFQKIEKDINSSIAQKFKNSEVTLLERSTLKKLKQLYDIKDEIKIFETVTLSKKSITEQEYLAALFLLSNLQQEIKRLQNKKKDIQEKLFLLKDDIQNTVPNESNHSLLAQQMQYAFYKLSQDKISKSLKLYLKLFENEFKLFESALPRVDFKELSSKKIIKNVDSKINLLKDKNLLLSIDKDSEALTDEKAQKIIIKKEKKIQEETDTTIIKKLQAEILLSLKWLKEEKQEPFLYAIEIIENDIKLLSKEEKEKFSSIAELLLTLEENKFDTSSAAMASTQIGLKYITDGALSFINKTLFVYEEKAFSLKTILTFIIFIIVGSIIAKIYKNIVDRFRKSNRIKSLSAARMIANSGYYIIILSTFFFALKSIGLNLHTIFIIIGAILVWIALGLQGFISNYAMGILMKIDRSIRIGDLVELDSDMIGCVDDMDFRSVTILTGDQTRITIPNSRFITETFINHSLEDHIKRFHILFSADNKIDNNVVQKVVLDALKKSEIPHINTAEKSPKVIIIDVNRKIVRYALLVWIDQHGGYDIPVEKSAFLALIHHSLKKVAL
jgi:small-conductance mechanosensitive channel